MPENGDSRFLLSALRGYLEGLKETGVEGLPYEKDLRGKAAGTGGAGGPSSASDSEPSAPEMLEGIRNDLGDCRRCGLGDTRTSLVFGVGNPASRLVFVGEAPGRDEDAQGEPFVGEAGQLLTRIIEAMGFSRQDVYICNVIKCRPPGNRNPSPEEVGACHPFLLRQIQAIAPEVIVALGTFAAQTLLRTREPISRLRGRFHDYHGIQLMPTFHPAYLLRNPAMKREVWDDMKAVMRKFGMEPPVSRQ
jgi:uracil-DNA glycosylase family 4